MDRVTPGVFEQESVIVWTDYATLSLFTVDQRTVDQIGSYSHYVINQLLYTYLCKHIENVFNFSLFVSGITAFER